MKVLMQSRPDLFDIQGGDTMQLLKTREHLAAMGVQVDLSLELAPDLTPYDLVHLFNLTRVHETYLQAANAVAQGKRYVLSSIYWDYREMNRKGRSGLRSVVFRLVRNEDLLENVKGMARVLMKRDSGTLRSVFSQWRTGFSAQRAFVLQNASLVLPNSASEGGLLRSRFGVDLEYQVVCNAADDLFGGKGDAGAFRERYGVSDCVLCVGRFDERKNQLSLVRAWKGVDIPLVLIGSPTPTHRRYYEKCRKVAGGRVLFLDGMDHEGLRHAFAAARVHVLPSWLETPGLSSLEAGLAGCNIVVTDRGSTAEYFGDMAWYCEPGDISSIRETVLTAYRAPRNDRLRQRIMERFTWRQAARQTLDAYEYVLRSGPAAERGA